MLTAAASAEIIGETDPRPLVLGLALKDPTLEALREVIDILVEYKIWR